MSIEQEIREEEARGVEADMRDAIIEIDTDKAMTVITAVELMNAVTNMLGEVDVDAVDAGTFEANSVEDYFHDLLIALRLHYEGSNMNAEIGEAINYLIWKSHRDNEVEPFIND
jgi:hypothetical protein